jgi:polysaccharide export outer membrane protein
MTGSMTLVEALARAGPLAPNAAAEIVVIRPPAGGNASGPVLPQQGDGPVGAPSTGGDPGRAEVIKVDLRGIEAGNLKNNVSLEPNDTVFVPEAPQVFVSGEVRNPGAYSYRPGLSVRQLVSMAGGLTPEGSLGRLRAIRKKDGRSREVKIGLDDPVQPGDTLVVRRKLF